MRRLLRFCDARKCVRNFSAYANHLCVRTENILAARKKVQNWYEKGNKKDRAAGIPGSSIGRSNDLRDED